MKKTCLVLVAMASLAVSGSGCGTVRNLASSDPERYGGVAKDIEYMGTPQSGSGKSHPLVIAVLGGELCASCVADTLTLPYVVLRERGVIAP
jgi:uncharacterized protein YceK